MTSLRSSWFSEGPVWVLLGSTDLEGYTTGRPNGLSPEGSRSDKLIGEKRVHELSFPQTPNGSELELRSDRRLNLRETHWTEGN